MSLEQLWKGTAKGNRKTAYHSHLAAPQETDPWHIGAGISITAAALLAAVKHFRCQTRPRPPLTQIRNVVSKEETCPKRFSQKDSLKNFSLLSYEAPPPLTQIRNVVPKEETYPKRFSQKDSLKTILSSVKRGPAPPSPKFEIWFQKRKPAQNASLKKILSKISLFCQTRPRPPLTQIRNMVPKEETCPKRFSQKNSLKTILSKRFSQKESLKKILSKRISQKDSLKTYWHPNP